MKQIRFIAALVLSSFITIGAYSQISPNTAIRELNNKKTDESIYHLTDAQKKQIKSIKDSERRDLLSLYNTMRSKKAQLKSFETSDTVEMKKINKLVDEIGDIYVKIYKSKAEHRQLVRNILTAEQRLDYDVRYSTGKENVRPNRTNEVRSQVPGNMPVIYIVNQDSQGRFPEMQTARQEFRIRELPPKPLMAVTNQVPVIEEAESDFSGVEEIEIEAEE